MFWCIWLFSNVNPFKTLKKLSFADQRLKNFNVTVGDANEYYIVEHVKKPIGRGETKVMDVTCRSLVGRYVMVKLNYRGILTLCEVEVQGREDIYHVYVINNLFCDKLFQSLFNQSNTQNT